jgi:hypothetical protein
LMHGPSGSYLVNALRSHRHYHHLFASLARDD